MSEPSHILLGVEEMYAADRLAGEAGVASLSLMEAAGLAVARAARARVAPCRVAILCGPGNNGGDGFVAARHLAQAGWPVRLALLGDCAKLTGDAAVNAGRWRGTVHGLAPEVLEGCELVIDALFGAGLGRPLEGAPLAVIEEVNRRGLACIGVDVPSGVHGDSGEVLGAAPRCVATVTFFKAKPGHLLMPGRALCGDVVLADIGIPERVLDAIGPRTTHNGPALWQGCVPRPDPQGHKYSRGHLVVVGGAAMTGAARLAARGARRIGAGLVSLAVPAAARDIYAGDWPGTIVETAEGADALAAILADSRRNAVVLGPGLGGGAPTRDLVRSARCAGPACVLDADALTAFADDPAVLFGLLDDRTVLTPHDGEFARIFPDLEGDRLARARAAAARSGATVLLKGPDTVVAAPDGRASIATNAPADLATAGAGDVLAGFVGGLLAQGMPAFEAAAAAVWIHGEAASAFGPGLIAEDLPEAVPAVLANLRCAEG